MENNKLPEITFSFFRRQFEIAFRMFDLNGDGDVDAEEFEKVQEIIRQTTSNGKKHREHGNSSQSIKKMSSALSNFFFGRLREKAKMKLRNKVRWGRQV